MSPPSLRLVDIDKGGPTAKLRSVALIGNYPPRRCGIATFTSDVREALLSVQPDLVCDVFAMTDEGASYAYPPEVAVEIRQNVTDDYLAAAARLSATNPDVICVEHEFGIFGGPAGEHLMLLLEATDRPVVSTLHTVLETPNDDQRRVFERLLARSVRVTVMAERGREILRRVWDVADDKIDVIPHGAPDRPLMDGERFKEMLGFAGREVLFTFGLLSPNKGIETVIRALPAIVAAQPTALYVVLGATHPHLVAQEGERYRESLQALARDLNVGDHLQLVDAYTDTPLLLNYLQAADVYITPYLNVAQVTSGTLSYAAALGKPIVSTPYWHAEELLSGDKGRLVPFADEQAISTEVIDLLTDPQARAALRQRVYDATRITVWSRFAERTLGVFAQAIATAQKQAMSPGARALRPVISLKGVRRMTDGCGMLQHSLFEVPDRRHGYCVDDNCRALILMNRLPGPATAENMALLSTYAAFVQDAWNDDEGHFRNFMSYERRWLEPKGSEDSNGRSIWSVAVTAAEAPQIAYRRWAEALMGRIAPHLGKITSVRADAFVILGLSALIKAGSASPALREAARLKLDHLVTLRADRRDMGLPWFEAVLSYDNARLPEALIRGGLALDRPDAVQLGVEALEWLCQRQTSAGGYFLPVATADFGRPLDSKSIFDQQPLEPAATLDACEAAYGATKDKRWLGEADRAFAWYFGANSSGVSVAAADGDCADGLTWAGVNENKGAESVLSLQLATCTYLQLTAATGGSLKTAGDR